MKYSENVDVVWFEYEQFYDGIKKPKETNLPNPEVIFKENLHQIITPDEILSVIEKFDIRWFAFAWKIFIDFKMIKANNIRFYDGILVEDIYFGILILLLAPKKIYKLNKILYHYRVRKNSIIQTAYNRDISQIPPFQREIFEKFRCDYKKAKKYYMAYSYVKSGFLVINASQNPIIIKNLTPFCIWYLDIYLRSKYDPFEIKPQLETLKPYLRYYAPSTRLAICFPNLYRFIRPLITILRSLKKRLRFY